MLSIVIPVYNEQDSLEALHREISDVAAAEGYDLDVIFVDDGSTDGSWRRIEGLAARDRRVRGIRFRRNFGKAAALSAGFAQARGELVMTFLAEMQKGLDVVSGWKKVRHDPWHKVGPSRVFNWMVSALTGVKLHDHNCGMKCYRREIFEEVRLYGELHRFVPVLAAARGYRVGELIIQHRPRQFGRSKYGLTRIVKGFLDLLTVKFLTGFGQRPQHVLGAVGLAFFSLGALALIYLAGDWILSRIGGDESAYVHLHQRALTYYSIAALLLGGQLISMGFLAELLIAIHPPQSKGYSIRERVGGPTPKREADQEKNEEKGVRIE
jgi:glycosyltransferase involved in cell wall biosynthesis